jgi:chromosome segregation ATPase
VCENDLSIVGKKLLAKCRVLKEENDELGRQISEGTLNTHKIELNLLKELVTELKRNLSESHEFVLQLDNEVEVMQNRIFDLQEQVNQLKKWKEIFAEQEKELNRLQQQLKEITQDTNNEVVSSPPQQQFTIEGSDNVDQEENESRS